MKALVLPRLKWALPIICLECLCGKPVVLVNGDGKEITAEILSATEKTIVIHRASDGKSFSLEIAGLSEQSQKLVSDWRADQPPPLTKHISLVLPVAWSEKVPALKVSLSLPEGEYNYPKAPPDPGLEFVHAEGRLSFYAKPQDLAKRELKEELERVRANFLEQKERDLANLTPERRAELEPLSFVSLEKHGDFEGYFVCRPGYQDCLGGQWILMNQKFRVEIGAVPMSKRVKPKSPAVGVGPFRRKNIPAILATLKVEKKK